MQFPTRAALRAWDKEFAGISSGWAPLFGTGVNPDADPSRTYLVNGKPWGSALVVNRMVIMVEGSRQQVKLRREPETAQGALPEGMLPMIVGKVRAELASLAGSLPANRERR